MEKVLQQAELLAESILESEVFIRMRLCEQAAAKDEGATALVAEYNEKRSRVETVLTANDLNHDELAKAGAELEGVEKELDDYALLKDMREAQAEFGDMMNKVNAIIKFVVTGESPEEGGCSGSCGSCGGCGGH